MTKKSQTPIWDQMNREYVLVDGAIRSVPLGQIVPQGQTVLTRKDSDDDC